MLVVDRTITCRDCGQPFVFTEGEQRFYVERGLSQARHPVLAVDWRDRNEQPLEEDRVGVIIIREMVGTSPNSWSDAARQAVATASRTVRNIKTVEVVKSSAVVDDGEITEYRVEIKIGFEYEG